MTDCTAFRGTAFTLTLDGRVGRAIYATLPTALATGGRIDIVAESGSPTGEIHRIRFCEE